MFKEKFKSDILNGWWTVFRPPQELPSGIQGTWQDLNDDIGNAYLSQFDKEIIEFSFSNDDRYAKYGDYTDLQDEWFDLYL